jgi:ABC-type multidrug transport system fused ATPase/permease subunit
MLATYRRIWALLAPRERRRAGLIAALIAAMSFTQMAGVASVMPFMAVAASPEALAANRYLIAAYGFFGFAEARAFLIFLGLVVFAGLVASILAKALTTYALVRFTEAWNYTLSRRLMAGYLAQPYDWFLARHSADLGKNILSEAEQVIRGALYPALFLLSEGAIVATLLALLVLIEPRLALTIALVLGGSYAAIYAVLRNLLKRIGGERVAANHDRHAVVQEAFGSIKDVKIGGLEGVLLKRFDAPALRFARARSAEMVASQMPRFAIEALAFGGLLALVLFLLAQPGGLQRFLPLLAAYAFAAYRLMPSLQNFYMYLVQLRSAGASLELLHEELAALGPGTRHPGRRAPDAVRGEASRDLATPVEPPSLPERRPRPLGLARGLALEGITYTYPAARRPAVRDLTLEVAANTTVGLVGRTGSGKTTTVDIVLGLLRPGHGCLSVDGVAIGADNLRAWQASIGYVPQAIYLADASVAANIAFGVPPGEVDPAAVERAARIANLHEFVAGELPQGYATAVGERGVRLSGGQRQRIGIARALYHDPDLLVLDEATSALDTLTEQAVMDAVHNLGRRKTIIVIAHRLTTVRDCDSIVLLEAGRVAAQGRFEELAEREAGFRAMVVGRAAE